MPKKEKKTKKHRSRDSSEERSRSRTHKSKHKKQRKESRSRSASPNNNVKLLQLLEERRLKERLERQKKKEELKAKETPEEKRARRLHEKQLKEVRRRERMGWDTEEYQHYTNQDNPFGDSNLMSTFVWGKKLEKEGLRDVPLATVEVLSRQKQLENKLELEKVKKRRLERELERQSREEEVVLQQRSREAAQFQEWERQEDQFHLEQARLRSLIRIQDGRAKPIDLLAQYISSNKLEDAIEMQVHEPYILLNGLGVKDLEDLLVDIKVYLELDKNGNSDFWDDMTIIVQDELQKLQKLEADGEDNPTVANRREGIHQSVAKDVSEIFRGKSAAQLDELRQRIEQKISIRSDGVDISYWESLLSQLKAHMARARLRDRHEENLRMKLKMLKSTSDDDFDAVTANANDEPTNKPSTSGSVATANNEAGKLTEDTAEIEAMDTGGASADNDENTSTFGDELEKCFHLYEGGNYSPRYITFEDIDKNSLVLTEEQDQQQLDALREQFLYKVYEDKHLSRDERIMRAEARKGMMSDEAEFSVETPLDDLPVQLASDKYRPRKPRYFNRVHTGFEWNKYNQTHYDMDNPPPKIVQGYKFNIFYPDLMDKSNTPQYFLTPCSDNHDFAILRFHAGPPYEDIAFKIVNREWEFSYKRGFRCQFHNNIFQLWFHFKRYRYRR